jgi:hypothetical protein
MSIIYPGCDDSATFLHLSIILPPLRRRGAPTENQPAKTKMPITKGSRDNFYLLVCFRGRNSNSICHHKYTISKSRPKDRFD